VLNRPKSAIHTHSNIRASARTVVDLPKTLSVVVKFFFSSAANRDVARLARSPVISISTVTQTRLRNYLRK